VDPTGKLLAYSTSAERMSMSLVDTATLQRARFELGRLLFEPAIAPDRSFVAFASNVEGDFDLWRLPLLNGVPAGDPVRLTQRLGTCTSPAISPDGRWLAFLHVVDGQRDVWIMAAAGGLAANLTDHPAVESCPEWSPDGRQLAFVSDRSGSEQVWVTRVSNGAAEDEPEQLTELGGGVTSPTWSPDGGSIGLAGPEGEAWVIAVDGTDPPRKLTEGAAAQAVVWSRAGDELLVLGYWGSPRLSIRAVDSRGGPARALLAAAPSEEAADLVGGFDVSADGRLLALAESSVHGNIWVLGAKAGRF
jgi:Tol biopolymer transport system component